MQLGLHSLRDQFVRTEERSFNSTHKWMGVRVRTRTMDPTEVSKTTMLCSVATCTSLKHIGEEVQHMKIWLAFHAVVTKYA